MSDVQARLQMIIGLIQQGKFRKAVAAADDVINAEPNQFDALHMKALACFSLKDLGRALESIERALGVRPTSPEALNSAAIILRAARRHGDAIARLEAALAVKPGYKEALFNLGNCHHDMGALEDALRCYDAALGLDPAFMSALLSRGLVLGELKRFDEAVESYDRLLALMPGHAEAHHRRAMMLKRIGRLDEAIASYEALIRLRPTSPQPWLDLARIASEAGRFEEAESKYTTAHRLNPDDVRALCGMARVRKFDGSEVLLPEYGRFLSNPMLVGSDRAKLHHAYAKICNDLGRYDEAMEQFSRGKALLNASFDVARYTEGYAALARLFTPEFFAERRGFGSEDERPVFIIGMPRSGTTLTEQILASHHQIAGLGELEELPDIGMAWCGEINNSEQFAARVRGLTASDVKAMAAHYLKVSGHSSANHIRLIDKRPHNYEWLGLIALMFPRAHVIHCQRDPLDTCVSIYMQKFNDAHGYNQQWSVLGRYYRGYADLMQHWSRVLPLPVHDCVYEDMVKDIETAARALVSFLGLAWDERCLEYHQLQRQVATPSRWQVRQPVYDSSVGRWKNYARHLGPLRQALGLGQEDEKVPASDA